MYDFFAYFLSKKYQSFQARGAGGEGILTPPPLKSFGLKLYYSFLLQLFLVNDVKVGQTRGAWGVGGMLPPLLENLLFKIFLKFFCKFV